MWFMFLVTVTATTNETAKWLASLPISMQNHSGGGSVALFWYRLPLSPTSWDFGPHQYVFGDDLALYKPGER